MVHQLKAFFLLAVQRSLMFSTINNDDMIKFEKIFGPKELFKTMKNYKLHIQIICINTKAQLYQILEYCNSKYLAVFLKVETRVLLEEVYPCLMR
ncbi:hypothetical protein R6Q57_008591 [Mikania cordata]